MRKVSAILIVILMICAGCAPGASSSATPAPATRDRVTDRPSPTSTEAASPTPAATIVSIILPGLTGTPFEFPPTVGSAPICENAPPTYLILHERGQVTNEDPQPLNIRNAPGLRGNIVGVLHSLDIFFVIDGPRCADDYTWFRVRAGGIEGWIAEGESGLYYVEPYIP